MRGAARTDSTHVLGSLPILRGWERTAQTMRAALNALAAAETQPGSQSTPIRSALSVTAGVSRTSGCPRARRPGHNTSKDGSRRRWHAPSRATRCSLHAPSPQRELAEVDLLRQIWEQYYEISDGQIRVLDPKEMPEGARRIESPYEVEKSLLASTLIGRASRELSRKGFEPSGCARSATGAWREPTCKNLPLPLRSMSVG